MHTELRKLSTKEKQYVSSFLSYAERNQLDEFQVGRLISKEVNFIGIRCDCVTKSVEIYKSDMANAHESYYIIKNLCDFLEELKDHGYIGIDTIIDEERLSDKKEGISFWIYNHKTHSVQNDELLTKVNGSLCAQNAGTPIEVFHSMELYSALENYVFNKVIYIKPALKELKENGFVSIEKKRHRTNVILQWIAIGCAIVFPFLNTLYSSCKGTKIISKDLSEINSKMDSLANDEIICECIVQTKDCQ